MIAWMQGEAPVIYLPNTLPVVDNRLNALTLPRPALIARSPEVRHQAARDLSPCRASGGFAMVARAARPGCVPRSGRLRPSDEGGMEAIMGNKCPMTKHP